jgi:hypothetical protein
MLTYCVTPHDIDERSKTVAAIPFFDPRAPFRCHDRFYRECAPLNTLLSQCFEVQKISSDKKKENMRMRSKKHINDKEQET